MVVIMNFENYKKWIGQHALTKDKWVTMCDPGSRVKLRQPDYIMFCQLELDSYAHAHRQQPRRQCRKDQQVRAEWEQRAREGIVLVTCGEKMTQSELLLYPFCCSRPTEAWHVLVDDPLVGEAYHTGIFVGSDGIMHNGGGGDGHSRYMLPHILMPDTSGISYGR